VCAAIVATGDDAQPGRVDDGGQDTGVRVGVEFFFRIREDNTAIAERHHGLIECIEKSGNDIGVE
jgi:hypothetical protein